MPELDVPVPADLGPAPESTAAVAAPAPSSRLGWGLLLALLVTLTVLGVLNRQLIVDQWVALQNYVSGQRPARPGAETAPDAAAAPRVGMSSTNQLPVKPDDSLIPDKESLVSARPAAESGTDAAAPVAAAPAPTSAPPAATPVPASALPAKTVTPTPSPAASNKNATAEREALLVDSRQWVRELPANGWVLQHAAREMLEDAKAEKAGSSALKDARILLAPRKSKGYYYIVVTGPYPNRATAQDLMKSTPGWSKAWLRGPKSMQQQFED
jgi:septal ring-binding cell division protein DamX